ncbi:hypothetical protein ABW19_dt0205761 [Dactylella cylindrospora]|nr:hypothetical protein ABW19_dt0205761 [Dactylella cylindrospora]
MNSKGSKYSEDKNEEDEESPDDIFMSSRPRKIASPSVSARPTTLNTASARKERGNFIARTLDDYFQKVASPRLSEQPQRDREQQAAADQRKANTTEQRVVSPVRSASANNARVGAVGGGTPSQQKIQVQHKRGRSLDESSDSDSEYEEAIRVPRNTGHAAQQSQRRRLRPSTLISQSSKQEFSKRDLLRQFEDTSEDSGEIGQEDSMESGESDEPFPKSHGSIKVVQSLRRPVQTSVPVVTSTSESGGATEGDEEESSEEEEEDTNGEEPATPTHTRVAPLEITPRRSMANINILENDLKTLEIQDQLMRQKLVKKVLAKNAEIEAKRNFDIVVTMPTYEEVADYLYNPDEWEARCITSRWTGENGHASYSLIYKDGHERIVEADNILEYVSMEILEGFENDLFSREENPETYYYPNLKPPGGAFAGGTGITSGFAKRRGRRSDTKIFLDSIYRLGMPEEFNIPMTDSSEEESESEGEATTRLTPRQGRANVDQYDKFDMMDQDILARIQENDSDDESWGETKRSGRGRPRGSANPRGPTRGSNVVRASQTSRGRGRPKLTPSRGNPIITISPAESTPKRARGSNVVKASATSRGRGRPRGSRNLNKPDKMDISSSSREHSPLSDIVVVKVSSSRGRPRGSKNLPKSSGSSRSETPATAGLALIPQAIQPPAATQKPRSPSTLKPTRTPKPPRTPSGSRGPGRPPKKEEDLIEETIRLAGANISAHSKTLQLHVSTHGSPERPKKRRRIKFGQEGPEVVEVSNHSSSPHRRPSSSKSSPVKDSHRHPYSPSRTHQSHSTKRYPASTSTINTGELPVTEVINKMLLDGSPAYHVVLRNDRANTLWVRLEDLTSKNARQLVQAFEKKLREREVVSQQLYDSINAQVQLERDKARLAEREAQIFGRKGGLTVAAAGTVGSGGSEDERTERERRKKEDERQRERAARRLAMQETLFAGT